MPQSKSKIIVILIVWKWIIKFRHVWKYCEKWLRFVISVRLSVRRSKWNNSASSGHILMKFDIWLIFEKSVEKIKVFLKFGHLGVCTFWKYLGKFLLDWKQLKIVACFKYWSSILTNDGRCTCEIKWRIAVAKAAFNKKRALLLAHWT